MTDQSRHLVFSGIAPHPPIMVPEVGRESIAGVRDSIEAMTELTERLIASGAETVILISPHAPLEIDSFVVYEGPEIYGDFANFRAPETSVTAPDSLRRSRNLRRLRKLSRARNECDRAGRRRTFDRD